MPPSAARCHQSEVVVMSTANPKRRDAAMDHPPFPVAHQLNTELDSLVLPITAQSPPLRLPGQPRILTTQRHAVRGLLEKEFLLGDLEEISGYLWIMSKQDSKSISPLHRQAVKGRSIVVTEDPRLHLIWHHGRIFIKPIPKYILSHRFWQAFLPPETPWSAGQDALLRAIFGYLRTYRSLVRYESDFRIATSEALQLIPGDVTFAAFVDFLSHFENIPDEDVSGRYGYGEIRLTRLNFYCKFLLGKTSFHRVYAQYGDYFSTFYTPMLFSFATFSVVLSAMQVEMSAEALDVESRWTGYWTFCRWSSLTILAITFALAFWLLLLFLLKFVREWIKAISDRMDRRRMMEVKARGPVA
ncbi:hypothetical protein QBC33DRAFT_553016 [Phialemonium atrogriseum]|uniref:Subtilisin-like serine protease protein n=1 Tax=Phialemonium atrogriseum TaxID=1093897 RepID=A0AAJ0BS14_9PEZI|nr:uncharacterized protein QBC33DRAFT_553016 [Phialemonium atrogriseum]KAK1762064.1 hypothetical protein QBC33DRAFT_553016 [Phialemonium atrogriseum]